ncbi:MAG: ABC transporter ATP-binding protein [Pirellulales bacterium]
MTSVRLDNVSKQFGRGVVALAGLNLQIAAGERIVVVGSSGSGKTTLLRLLAGLDSPTGGRIWFGEQDVTTTPPWQRAVAVVSESAALLPHLTVTDNLMWSWRQRRSGRQITRIGRALRRWWTGSGDGSGESDAALGPSATGKQLPTSTDEPTMDAPGAPCGLDELTQRLGLESLRERLPGELSAGQQQRVALGRALLAQPRLLLLDEPLGRLAGPQRLELARLLRQLQRASGATWVYVTHDRTEALALADRIVVLEQGRLLQTGKTGQLLARPRHRQVAEWGTDDPLSQLCGSWRWSAGRRWFHSRWLSAPVAVPEARGPARVAGVGELIAGESQAGESQAGEYQAGEYQAAEAADSSPGVEAVWLPGEMELLRAGAGGLAGSRPAGLESVAVAWGIVDEIEDQGPRRLVWVKLFDPAGSADGAPARDEAGGADRTNVPECGRGATALAATRLVAVERVAGEWSPGDCVVVRFDWGQTRWFDSASGRTLVVGEEEEHESE